MAHGRFVMMAARWSTHKNYWLSWESAKHSKIQNSQSSKLDWSNAYNIYFKPLLTFRNDFTTIFWSNNASYFKVFHRIRPLKIALIVMRFIHKVIALPINLTLSLTLFFSWCRKWMLGIFYVSANNEHIILKTIARRS